MSDLIDRQAAIDALKTCQTYLFDTRDPDKKISLESAVYELEQLPSAHPELNEWCHDCKEYDTEKGCCPRWGQVIRTALADAQQEIIRCKDCKYYRPMIDQDDLCDYRQMQVFDDDFCSRAEPYKGEQE